MKQPPYFKLTEVEPQVALWGGLMLMLVTVAMMIALTSQRLTNTSGATAEGVQPKAQQQQQQNLVHALQQVFAAEGQQGRISILKTRTHIQLTINAQQLFPPHGTELSSTGKNVLNRLAQTLKTLPSANYQKIQIEEYAERAPYNASSYPHDNWELSSGQAVSALKYLATTANLEMRLFSAHSYADLRSLPASTTEAEKVMNQRLIINIFLTTHQA